MTAVRYRIVLAIAVCFAPLIHAQESAAARIARWAAPLAESGFLSGILLVDRPGTDTVRLAFGFADPDRTISLTSTTPVCIASITKPMTAVALMRLVDRGDLALDAPVSRWLDGFPSGDEITVADLVTHRAGIPHRVTTPEEERNHLTPGDIVDRIKQQGLLFPPGSERRYSSAGYTVLAYIMERVTGQSWGAAMDLLLFAPLGMERTVHPDGRAIPGRAISFIAGPKGPVAAPDKDYAFLAGAGSLYSTPDDVARFARAYLDRDFLSEAAWQQFHDLGWGEGDTVTWTGSTNGYACWMDIDKTTGNVQIFIGNAGTGAAYLLRDALPALLSGDPIDPAPAAPEPIGLDADRLNGLEGEFGGSASGPVTLRVVRRNGDLLMNDSFVYPVAEDRFFNPTYFSHATFERDKEDRAITIRITAPGLRQPLVFHRVEP